jgi:hypothetical protein
MIKERLELMSLVPMRWGEGRMVVLRKRGTENPAKPEKAKATSPAQPAMPEKATPPSRLMSESH